MTHRTKAPEGETEEDDFNVPWRFRG